MGEQKRVRRATIVQRVGWWVVWHLARALSIPLLRLVTVRRGRMPATGPALIIANHQSYLDPPLVTMAIGPRRICFLARSGLFKVWWLAPIIRFFNAYPLREDGHDPRAIRAVLDLLDAGEAVLVFPEGSRTHDGAMRPLKRGVALLVRRARCPVVPVAIEGAFDAWPRTRRWPRLCPVATMTGEPIDPAQIESLGTDELLEMLGERIDSMRLELRAMLRRRTGGRFPPPGAGDRSIASGRHQRADAVGGGGV